jgi:hypothetical protein
MAPSDPKLLSHCPLCQATYHDRSIRLLGEQGTTRLFHLTCDTCNHSVLAVILESQSGVSSIGLVTDLEAREAVAFRDAPVVSADDCVKAHVFLEERSREFCRALNP